MHCPYLNEDNACKAKPYGAEPYIPDKQTLTNYCMNANEAEACTRAVIYKTYLKVGGK